MSDPEVPKSTTMEDHPVEENLEAHVQLLELRRQRFRLRRQQFLCGVVAVPSLPTGYRTSSDKFVPPDGPEAYRRLMKLRTVPENHKLGEDGLWDRIRAEVQGVLDARQSLSSVDLVRFTWVEKNEDEEDQEDQDDQDNVNYDDIAPIKPVMGGTVYTTPATIWAYDFSMDILDLPKQYNITDVDVAYRESEVKFLGGPELFAPVSDLDPLKDVIGLSTPVTGLQTRMQGTLEFYFRIGEDLYAVTSRHILFKDNEDNVEYNSVAGPKEVISTIALVEGGGSRAEQSGLELLEAQEQLTKTRTKIDALKAHFVTVKMWNKAKDRVIGHVVWAPPISVTTPPHQRNVLSLGPEISPANFKKLMYDRFDAPHEFVYPPEGLFKLDPIRRVIKRGYTTMGGLSGFLSQVRRYFATGNIDSVGSVIIDSLGRFVALLTGGTGKTDSSDITFGTPMHWLWLLILARFDGANLYWDDNN
ncbi:unnamed protein product [Cyclocybe aegerita]|uniref:Uncharacterized protein n=1 Tax=Cyclocybe aegerita TaxID=1973307 RepID=A0A8S0VQ63_CYCAE|nr:unnamed protein product [Cyclocybe aegerita]